MINTINRFLDTTTMYKVVMYSLTALIVQAFIFSLFKIIPYSIFALLTSFVLILASSLLVHYLFKKIYDAPANIESTYISIFIAFFILAPVTELQQGIWVVLASVIMIASKYIVAYSYRHIFNPVAFGVFVIGVMGSVSAIWWVGSMYFLPSLLIITLLIIHKIKRYSLFLSYFMASVITIIALAMYRDEQIVELLLQHILSWPLLFLGAFMLTEPLTTPPTRKTQILYGSIVGVLSSAPYAFHPIYSTPELALLLGNIVSYTMSTKERYFLPFIEKIKIAKDTYELVFQPRNKIDYTAGQYMEWTLPHEHTDARGIRRYFTIASSPLEDMIRIGIKGVEKGSAFKNNLLSLHTGMGVLATSVSGDFLLPTDASKKLVFIAGGIGITPFISMIRTLLITQEKRDIILFYSNKTEEEIAYKHVLEQGEKELGIKVVHVLSDLEKISSSWQGEKGFITSEMIKDSLKDYKERSYFISGPPGMVAAYTTTLKDMGVSSFDIVTDFFPGFA